MGIDMYWGGELGSQHEDASAVQPSDVNEDVSNADDPPSSIISSEHESDVSIVSESLTLNVSIGEHGPTPAECPQSDSSSSQMQTSIIGSSCLPNVESSLNAGANTSTSSQSTHGTMLPWGVHKERPGLQPLTVDTDLRPGEFVMRTLFADFTLQAERKMEAVMNEPLEKLLSKTLQRGEDPKLDQVLSSFGTVAEHCLPSLLRALFGWLERQMQDSFQLSEQSKKPQPQDQKNKSIMYIVSGSGTGTEAVERSCEELLAERRDLAVEFLFCLALIEVLKQLQFHPGHEDLVQHIENLAFKRFNYKEGIQSSPNAANIHIIADLYAEVIGVLAQARFSAVKKRFTAELKELKSREPSPHTTQSIISLLMGMKFFRVKMVPIEEFEASFQFLQECAQYFLEAKDKDVKHALAGLFVEILVPVAAIVKNEVNVPCLKSFVEMLYSQTLDASTKSKHRLALFPLVTCLLCVSQKAFFLANWHYFLAMCLSHLKNKDTKMCRVALESLYRLLWVYMIRIKCESNSATQSRLQSIVNSLFPKGSKGVVPRDTPLNIFVKIIQFIAQERLDFAMREIVFDLLMVGRPIKIIYTPERMSIGLRAFLVVADSLQQKEGEPPMPRTAGTLPSGNTLRVKKTYLNKVLTEETAKSIGMCAYFPYVRRVLVEILRALDAQYGRPLMMTNTQNITKEQEINTGERKPRIDLFRTCVAAIPRLLPDGMSGVELVEMLSRLTVHMDEELRGLAYQSLQTLIVDFPEWRTDVLSGFLQFLTRDVQDVSPQLVDNGLRMLLQLITSWKNTLNATTTNAVFKQDHILLVLRSVEAFSLVMLCQCRLYPHRIAVHVLREVKQLLERLQVSSDEPSLSDAADALIGPLIEQCLPLLPLTEKQALLAVAQPDLLWLADRTHIVWTAGLQQDEHNVTISTYNLSGNVSPPDPWGVILFGLLQRDKLPLKCPTAIHATWPVLFARINALFTTIDPTPVSDNRASLLRSAAPPRKPTNERDVYLHVWKNYLMMSYHVVPPIPSPIIRCASPDLSLSSSPDSLSGERSSVDGKGSLTTGNTLGTGTAVSGASPATLHKLAVQLLRCETADVRDAAVNAIGYVNSSALKDLMEELVPLIREAVDRKQENMRRRRRRDALRLHLGRVLRLIAQNGTFANCAFVLENGSLHPFFVEYLDGTRLCLEAETDKDSPSLREVKLIFCDFVTKIIKNFPLEMYNTLLKRELRKNLFQLFAAWSGPFVKFLGHFPLPTGQQIATETDEKLHLAALQAMSALACCGPYFTPADLAEEGSLYPWLNQMLSSINDKIYELATETVVLMLECNPDIGLLLDWTVDKCYTGEPRVADGCFLALSNIFSAREYPCDHYTAVINVTLMCTGCPRATVRDAALQLLQLLDARFFGDIGPPLPPDDDTGTDRGRGTLDALLCTTYCRSQLYLSRQLAHLHPELTMPMFSEITHRFQTARPEVRQLLLQYLLPWLVNIELVDPNVPPANPLSYFQYYASEASRASGRREGLGSAEATEMVLNNLFYITAKFSDCHPKEIEELWSTLCSCWPNNLKVIIRYLMIVSGMAPNDLLPYAKRVVVYLARSRSDRLLDEMMTELQTVETLNCLIERTETPPFYRLTSVRKTSSHSDGGCGVGQPGNVTGEPDVNVTVGVSTDLAEKGTIHTKRHSGEDPAKSSSLKNDVALRTVPPQPPPLPPQELDTVVSPEQEHQVTEESSLSVVAGMGNVPRMEAPQPRPLPMPEYGGYFAPLTEYLPDSTQPISGFHRCNVAVMLLCDVVIDGVDLDWSIHVPLMLHIAFLGMDHTRAIVHEHCRQLLLNLLVTVAAHHDHLTVARVLLGSCTTRLELGLSTSQLPVLIHNFTEPDSMFDSYLQGTSTHTHHSHTVQHGHTSLETDEKQTPEAKEVETATCSSLPVIVTGDSDLITDSTRTIIAGNIVGLPQPGPDMPISDVIKSLIHFLANRPNNLPLWNYEDITAKVWTVRSCQQLNTLLQHVLRVFRESLPHALVSERWAQTALQLGLSCPSRHYAGRSLQVFRFIGVAMTGRMVSDMLSRLVETVAEQGEDMQGYVTELLLTLESAVDSLESNFRPLDYMRDIFKSTPNLNNKDATVPSGPLTSGGCIGCASNHTRSTSYSVSYCMRKSAATTSTSSTEGKEVRTRICMDPPNKMCTNLCRSRSAQSLKLLGDSSTQDDKLTILATLFWLGVSLLESDYEHEFLLGARLLTRVMRRLPLDRPDARDRVDRLHAQLRWPSFPGVHALLLKGCTHPATYEPVVGLLGELTPLLELSVVDPTQSLAFPMTVVALLPYMLLHYEDANELCVRAACHIAQVSAEKGKKLENLGTVMSLYSRRTFSKESFQWTKCVVKYLWDTYSHLSLQMLAFLVEVLEKGAPTLQLPVLSILHCMLHYVDLNASSAQPINADLLRVVAKFIDGGANFKEAMKILKLVVTRCSTLVVPPHWDTNTSFVDTEQHSKKELPGRTMDFTFDLSQTPVIGRRYLAKSSTTMTSTSSGSGGTGPNSLTTGMPSSLDKTSSNSSSTVIAQDDDASICSTIVGAVIGTPAAGTNKGVSGESNPIFVPPINQSPRRLASLSPADAASISGWKRPWMSQGRVRECLVNLLTTCGQRVGLPKSPSVIFSQSSELVERESSMASSLEEVSAAAGHGDVSGASRCAPRDIPPTAPDHFAVFKDFDFLEYESESIEGESSDNFNWGVRRLLLSEETDQATPSSSRKLERNSSAIFEPSSSQHKVHHTITTPENTTRRKIISGEDSSDDELISESPPDEGGNSGVGMSGVALGLPPRSLTLRPRTHSASSGSSGGGDLGDLTPCAGSSTRSHDSWKNSVLMMMLRECPPHSPILFVHRTHTILKEIIDKTLSLCLEGTRCLTSATNSCVPTIAVTTVVDQLSHETLPLIWVGPSAVSNTLVWEAIKYASLEMNEHLETYFDRKEHVVECLESMPRFGTENIGRSLYKLLFQLILLLETYGKMVSSIYNAALDKNAIDCSSLVASVKEALSGYEWGSEHGTGDTPTPTASACPSPQPSSSLPQSDDTAIMQLLNEFRWTAALSLIRERNAKRILERGEFSEDDLTSLLHIYCSSLMTTHPDMVAITRPVSELIENLSLMIKNLFKVSLVLKMNNLHSI